MRTGLDYYPTSCILDDEYKIINARYGAAGIGILEILLRKIYGVEGYFCNWSEDLMYIFASENSFDPKLVNSLIELLLQRDYFCKELYEKYSILTSEKIQKTFFDAAKRRKTLEVKTEYIVCESLISYVNVSKNEEIADNSSKNVNKPKQRRVKESKVKESKVKESRGEEATAVAEADRPAVPSGACGTTAEKEKENIDFDKVGESFNRICSSLTPVKAMSERRKKAISECIPYIKDHGGFEKLFEEVKNSGFLCGKNKNGWKATFDWVIKADNALKILEGNFRDKKEKRGSFDTDDFFLAALKRSYGDSFSEEELRCSL